MDEPRAAGRPLDTRDLLPAEFYARHPVDVARDLLGCVLASTAGGELTAGVIVETEAYLGTGDPGSHAATKGVTRRNEVLYGPPGTAYVYFTYGNHYLFNVVCEPEGTAGAVLVRALRPTVGVEAMTSRRRGRPLRELCDGPGKLAEALGIDLEDNRSVLGQGRASVYRGVPLDPGHVAVSGRVGLSHGHELPLRFYVKDDPFVSRGRTGPLAPKKRRSSTSVKGTR
jgi:DNA-3-methyladenine glycosylase